jgi:hypothetical protein
MLLSCKFLTLDVGSDPFADIGEYGRPIVPIPEDFVGCGSLEMVPSTQVTVKFSHDHLSFWWAHAF